MDDTRFDAMTKAWVRAPRRQVLGGLVGGALSTLLGHRAQEARATLLLCKRTRNCPKGKVCANKVCVPKCSDPFNCGSASGTGCTDPDCFCAKKPGGGGVCVRAGGVQCDATLRACTRQSDCNLAEVCANGCCGDFPKFFCQPACDA